MPNLNPDGTTQVLPPLQSAFGPASASAPPSPMQAPGMAPQAAAAPDSGFASAIMALIHSLVGAAAPHSITDIKARNDRAIDKASE